MFNIEFKTIIEPFRVKMVEPLPLLTPEKRLKAIENAHFNLFRLPASAVTFDFLTDSGTSAMSATQWAGMMVGDESYAGSRSFEHFESVIQELTGLPHVIPTHQGRSAEHLLMSAALKKGQIVIGNTHFDTTRANIEVTGGVAMDMPAPENRDSERYAPFKGNIDIQWLKDYLREHSSQVPFVIMTVTNNSVGGQPVSMENLKQTKEILTHYGIPMFIDAARFAENSFFIKKRETGYNQKSPREIAKEMFRLADGVLMSAKKDAFGNIGGFLALRSDELAQTIRNLMVVTEGFPTYGGLAGRDLEALAIGLEEILDANYLSYRIRSVEYFGEGISQAGYVTVKPYGGHAVYIDAGKTLSHIPAPHFPGQSLAVALYQAMGIRSVEVGSLMFGQAPKELVRLAMPRRAYTQSHVDYILEGMRGLKKYLPELPGYQITWQSPVLRHFTARLQQRK